MSENTSFYQHQPYSSGYRQGRRRWVPKGVALLAILFVVGLLGACHSPSQPAAAIAVPVDELDPVTATVNAGASSWIVAAGQEWTLAQRETMALNTF